MLMGIDFYIFRIEMEVDFLERQESIISTNESLILNRLKAVEKNPKAIITVSSAFPPDRPGALTRS